jgi:hypothetical protein
MKSLLKPHRENRHVHQEEATIPLPNHEDSGFITCASNSVKAETYVDKRLVRLGV